MLPVWKILAPVDLSVNAEAQVDHALDVAGAFNADLTLLSVTGKPQSEGVRRPNWPANAIYRPQTNVDVHRMLLPGGVPETIVDYAQFLHTDLIVMTSRNFGSWRLWNRSVAATVMDRARAPLWLTKRHSVESGYRFRCRRILTHVNLDGADEPALLRAGEIAQRTGAELILLAVIPAISEGLLLESIPGIDRPLSRNVAYERMRNLRWSLPVPSRSLVMVGSPYRSIRAAVREYSADLVLTSNADRHYPNIYGPDVPSIFKDLPCPLLSARAMPAVHPGFHTEETPVAAKILRQ